MDEAQLILQSQQGSLEAFNALVERYQGQVFNVALRMLGDAAAAEDVTQETFLAAYQHLCRFREGNFRAWLLRIATNACRDYLRSARVRYDLSLEALTDNPGVVFQSEEESPEHYTLRQELAEVIHQGLAQLPVEQRLAVVLVDIQGLSYEEAAQAMGVPVGTVKSRLSRGRLALRDFLATYRELLPGEFRS